MNDAKTPALPFPVVLDLSAQNVYNTMIFALTEYAEKCDADAAYEGQSAEYNGVADDGRPAELREEAAIARELLTDIERQLDETGKEKS